MSSVDYRTSFITERHEASLLSQLASKDTKARVQHFGFNHNPDKRQITKADYLGPLPKWGETLAFLIKPSYFNQCSVVQLGSQGSRPVIDPEPCYDNIVAIVSLGSPITLTFTNRNDESQPIGMEYPMELERRSLLVLSGTARFQWLRHVEPAERQTYLGITFRKVLHPNLQLDDELIIGLRAELNGTIAKVEYEK